MLSVPPSYHGIPVATEAFFEAARRAGLPVHVWTINDPEQAAAFWRRGASGIITDDPRRLAGGYG
jgi:glycerophosphoryl diester phosphodiesterase